MSLLSFLFSQMKNNFFTDPFSDFSEPSNQNYTRNLFTKSLIQNSTNLNSLPQILEKYAGNNPSYPKQYIIEPEPKEFLKRSIFQQQVCHQDNKINNDKDPRIKAEFYQEKVIYADNPLNSLINMPLKPTDDDIFRRDFIPFQAREQREQESDGDIQELERRGAFKTDNFNVSSKKIKKFNVPTKYKPNHFERKPDNFEKTYNNNFEGNPINFERKPNNYEAEPLAPSINPQYLEPKHFSGKDLTELIRREHQKLPIFNRSKVILESIEKEQVVVISGDTGCGKSTQVPKYIYLDARSKNKRVKIVCTQPRRMAALNLAKRVAFELNERLGGIVGYQISLDSKKNEHTAILYVTNGIFLQSLIHDKNIFEEVTHVILDEIHERDIDSDFTMIAMKHLLNENPHIKLILMSATINVQLFVNYFSRDEIKNCHNKEYNYSLNANSKKWEKLNNWEDFDPKISWMDKAPAEEENIPWTNIKIKKEREVNLYGVNKKVDGSKDMHLEQYNINMNDLPAYSVEIPSDKNNYRVKTFYIDTMENYAGKQLMNGIEFRYIDFDRKKPNLHYECVQLAIVIIKNILNKDDEEKQKLNQKNMAFRKSLDGSILIFLPGF